MSTLVQINRLRQIIAGFWLSRAVYVAAKLRIADHLADGPKTAEQLAIETGTYASHLYRILRALSSADIFSEDAAGRFSLTPLGATLQSGTPGSLRSYACVQLGEEHYPAWGGLLDAVTSGSTAFQTVFGESIWDFYATNAENGSLFDEAMRETSSGGDQYLLDAYDFSGLDTVVDVGGGTGGLLASILATGQVKSGVLFEVDEVVERARVHVGSLPVASQFVFERGDFFESVPAGGDAYILKRIVHDWSDDDAVRILCNCRKVMRSSDKILLIEAVIPKGNGSFFHKFGDLNMLVMQGGKERTETEFRDLLQRAGFQLNRIVPTITEVSIIEGQPAVQAT